MKTSHILAAAVLSAAVSAQASPTVVDSAYSLASYYSTGNANSIVSYDWDSQGNLYYQTSNSSSAFLGVYKYSNGTVSTIAAANESIFAGASVVTVGNSLYYNNSDLSGNQNIYLYNPLNGSSSLSLTSTTPNYGLYGYNNALYIAGAVGWGTNHIYYSSLNTNGTLVNNSAIDLGETSGASGPLVFDKAGNLYYAPGYYDLSIYRWTAAEVAAAIADPTANALSATGHLWEDYSSLYASVGGATSLAIDSNGDLLASLTSFSDPSSLVKFGVSDTGTYDGTSSTILTTTDRLGELRVEDGTVYVSDGDQIFTVVPEPSSFALMGMGVLFVGVMALRRHRQALAIASIQ